MAPEINLVLARIVTSLLDHPNSSLIGPYSRGNITVGTPKMNIWQMKDAKTTIQP
jgi:hypothetical protein